MLTPFLQDNLPLHSRIHLFQSYFANSPQASVFIKRDDELGNGTAGSKWRKFSSLLRHYSENQYDEIVVIGSPHSNSVLLALQLMKGLPLHLFLLESHAKELTGNALFIQMLAAGEKTTFISRTQWPEVDSLADAYREEQAQKGKRVYILREGASTPEALPGAMTLGLDILRNQEESGLAFCHLFLDSGTGTTAIGALLALQYAGVQDMTVHVTLIAGSEGEFLEKWDRYGRAAEVMLQMPLPGNRPEVRFHRPTTAASFGTVNRTVLKETWRIAREEGILMEPIYTVKHLLTARQVIENERLSGNMLFVNSGNPLGLAGFLPQLAGVGSGFAFTPSSRD